MAARGRKGRKVESGVWERPQRRDRFLNITSPPRGEEILADSLLHGFPLHSAGEDKGEGESLVAAKGRAGISAVRVQVLKNFRAA